MTYFFQLFVRKYPAPGTNGVKIVDIMKNERCAPNAIASLNREELQKNERKHKLERTFFMGSVIALAVGLVVTAFLAKESVGYTIISSVYTSIGFVLVLMIDKASKKLAMVRREIQLR